MNIDVSSDLYSQLTPKAQSFLETLKSFESMVQKYHPNTRAYSETPLLKFIELSEDRQNKIIGNFTSYISFLAQCSAQDLDLSADPAMFSKYLKEFGFIYDEDLVHQFKKEDVLEVYTAEPVQIFRNLRFFEVCNYTLLDLVVYEPYELYERSLQVNAALMDMVTRMMSRPFDTSPLDLSHIPEHVLREKFSSQKLTSIVRFKRVYPLYRWPHLFAGFLLVQEGENLPWTETEISFL